MKTKNSKRINIFIGILSLGISGFAFHFAKAWTEPATPPPASNVGAPVTTGSISQIKTGSFRAAGSVVADGAIGAAQIVSSGLIDNGIQLNKIAAAGGGWNYMEWLLNGARQYWAGLNGAGIFTIQSYTNNNILLNPNGGNIGIGTNAPASKLDVQGGDVNVSGQGRFKGWFTQGTGLAAEIGVSSGQSYVYSYDRSAGSYQPINLSGSVVGIGHSGATDILINGSGNVGIGAASPSYKLDVAGQARAFMFVDDDPTYYADLNSGGNLGGNWNFSGNVTAGQLCVGGTCKNAWPSAAGDNLGNHTATQDLNMNGSSIVNTNTIYTSNWFRSYGGSGWYNETYAGGIYMTDSTWVKTYNDKGIWTGGGYLGSNGGLTIGYDQASPPSRGAIFGGNVGIGTTTPSDKLDVIGGDVRIGLSGQSSKLIMNTNTTHSGASVDVWGATYGVYGASSGTGVFGDGVTYGVFGNASNVGVYGSGNTYGVYGNAGAGIGGYFTSTSGPALITGTGKVGIGTNNPSAKLSVGGMGDPSQIIYADIAGSSAITAIYAKATGVAGGVGLRAYGDTAVDAESTTGVGVYGYGDQIGVQGDGRVMGVKGTSTTGYGVYCTGVSCGGNKAWTNSSDERLKTNIQTIPDALDKVMKLRGVNFDWKDGSGSDSGFIAQEAMQVMPQLVRKNSDGYYGMETGSMTGVLTEAIKAQQKEIEDLKAEIELLKK